MLPFLRSRDEEAATVLHQRNHRVAISNRSETVKLLSEPWSGRDDMQISGAEIDIISMRTGENVFLEGGMGALNPMMARCAEHNHQKQP